MSQNYKNTVKKIVGRRMTVGKKKDGCRKRTVGEEVWWEKKDSKGKMDGWKRKNGPKKRTVKKKPVGRVHKNTDMETLMWRLE